MTTQFQSEDFDRSPALSQTAWAVSYTHLDVYKRQVQRRSMPSFWRARPWCGWLKEWSCTAPASWGSTGSSSVSYTHLDVYKRQTG